MVRRKAIQFLLPVALVCGGLFPTYGNAEESNDDAALKSRFEYLSQQGNVQCSAQFEKSIAIMPADAKLQGSCCAPMDAARYRQQLEGLRKYSDIAEVPPDPYDISASLAYKLMGYYDLALNKEEQGAYDYDGTFRHAGPMLLQVLALEGVRRSRQVPDPRASLYRPASR